MTIALWQRPLARVVAGIVSANNGAWFDPSDMSTLYQDAAGTTPVTAVEQPVGLHLDKSRGLQLGNEIVPDPTFSQWTDPSVPDGWIKTGTHNASNYVQESSSALRLVSDGTYIGVTTTSALTIGKTYRVKFDIVSSTMGSVAVLLGAGTDLIRSAPGSYSATIKATGTTIDVKRNAGSAVDIVVDNLSVRELPGNHATQSITASRPTLSARYNLLTKTEDFSDAVWIKNYCTVTTNTTADPFGGTSADTITSSSSTINTSIYQVAPTLTSGATYTVSRYVKAGSVTKCTLGLHQLADIYFDLNALTYNAIGTGFISASIVDVGNGWRKITGSWTWSGTIYQVYFALASTMSSQIGVPVGGYLYSFGHSLVLGPTPGPYQRVNTSTDYDTDERYFKKYLRFDGVDDYLNLPYMGLYANGSASVVMGISRAKAGAVKYAITEGNTAGGKNYIPFRLSNTGVSSRIVNDAGTVVVLTPESAGSASSLPEILSFKDTGNTLTLHKNSSQTNLTNYTRAGSLTLNNLTVGAIVQASVAENMLANLYGLIITKSALTDAQRIKCERFLARKAGVML